MLNICVDKPYVNTQKQFIISACYLGSVCVHICVDTRKAIMSRIPNLLTPEEAAEILNRPVGTINRWRTEGRGPRSLKIVGRVRYDLEDVLMYIRQSSREPSARANVEERFVCR
jgi:hypothetical protein